MTRGTLFYYESDDKIYSSTEFNGDMYHGTPEESEGMGAEVIKLMSNLKNLDDFKKVLKKINTHYKYDEGNDYYPVGEKAIAKDIADTIEWIDKERLDLKGSNLDPRTWKARPTFKDVRTWHFWGVPNLSDYSYIFNNSGKDLVLTTKSEVPEMIIPNGALGVLNFGRKDCICKDGKMTDLREDEEE